MSATTGPGRAMTPRALLQLLLIGGGWGLHLVFTKALGAEGLGQAMAILVLYIFGTAAGLVVLGLSQSRAFRPRAAELRFFAISASLGYLGPILAELLIAPKIDAGVFALIGGTTPVATVALAALLGFEHPRRTLVAALALGAVAVAVLVGPGIGGTGPAGWVALALLVPLLYGADNLYIERAWPERLDIFQVAAGEGITACVTVTALALAVGVTPGDVAAAAAAGGWVLAGLVVTSFVATALYFAVARSDGAVVVSFASYVAVAAGVAGGALVFGERPGWGLALAAALIAASLALLRRDRAAAAATLR